MFCMHIKLVLIGLPNFSSPPHVNISLQPMLIGCTLHYVLTKQEWSPKYCITVLFVPNSIRQCIGCPVWCMDVHQYVWGDMLCSRNCICCWSYPGKKYGPVYAHAFDSIHVLVLYFLLAPLLLLSIAYAKGKTTKRTITSDPSKYRNAPGCSTSKRERVCILIAANPQCLQTSTAACA